MSYTIALAPYSSTGHCNAFVGIVKCLLHSGHQVIVIVRAKYHKLFKHLGCQLVNGDLEVWAGSVALRFRDVDREKYVRRIFKDFLSDTVFNKSRRKLKLAVNLIDRLEFDLLFIDRFNSSILFLLDHEIKRRSVIVNAMVDPYRSVFNTTLNSGLAPSDLLFKVRNWINWHLHAVNSMLQRSMLFFQDDWTITKRLMYVGSMETVLFESISHLHGSGHIGIKSVLEVCTGYSSFEFPSANSVKNVSHLAIHYTPPAKPLENSFAIIEAVKMRVVELSASYIVYCSMGSLATAHNANVDQVLRIIVSSFENEQDKM